MGRVGGEQEEGMMLQREVLCFSGQKQRLSARHNLKIHNGDRNPVVKRWLLTHCAGAKALLQLLIKKMVALTFNRHQLLSQTTKHDPGAF